MKGFMLDSNGDVVIEKNKIVMIEDALLKAQTVRTLLGTNKGEWVLNVEEGINFRNILGKNKNAFNALEYARETGGLTEAEELLLAQRLRKRLDGDG